MQTCGRYKIWCIDHLFPKNSENTLGNPQDSCLLGRGLDSGTPEYKAGVSITREQLEVSVTSCVLPTFRRTTPLNDITLYEPYKSCSSRRTVLRVRSESRTER